MNIATKLLLKFALRWIGLKAIRPARRRIAISRQYRSGERRMDLAHGKTSFICGAGLSGLPGLSAGCQGFRRHDGNRAHELCSLAVYARASIRGNRLDLRLLDWTQLRCCSK